MKIGSSAIIEDSAKGDAKSGLFGIPLRADQVRQPGIPHRGDGADGTGPKHIARAEIIGLRIGAQHRKEPTPGQKDHKPVDQRNRGGRPNAERGSSFCRKLAGFGGAWLLETAWG